MGEGLLTEVAFVGPDPSVRPGVSLQVECVVETFSTEGAEVPLDIRVALHMPVQEPL